MTTRLAEGQCELLSNLPKNILARLISATLISGKRDAVLVHTSIDQSRKIVDWIVESGKNLTAIYSTRGHGDRFFGLNTIWTGPEEITFAEPILLAWGVAWSRKQSGVRNLCHLSTEARDH